MQADGKAGTLKIKRGGNWEVIPGFAGLFTGLKVSWEAEKPEYKIKAQHKFTLYFKCKHDGAIESRAIDFRSKTISVTPTVINALLAAVRNPLWDGYFSFRIWKDEAKDRVGVKVGVDRSDTNAHAPVVYPFNTTTKYLDGVPAPEIMPNGDKDWTKAVDFWVERAKEIEALYVPQSVPQAPKSMTAEVALNGNRTLRGYNDARLVLKNQSGNIEAKLVMDEFARLVGMANDDGFAYNAEERIFEITQLVEPGATEELPF